MHVNTAKMFVTRIFKFFHLFMLISDDFRLKKPKMAKRVPRFLADVRKDG